MSDWVTTPAPGEEKIPPAPLVRRWSKADAGCIIDGAARGFHDSGVQLIRVALMSGWEETAGDEPIVTKAFAGGGFTDNEHDQWRDLLDEIEKWLNDNVAPEGYSFGWEDGDFFLNSEETWCEWHESTCPDTDHHHFTAAVHG